MRSETEPNGQPARSFIEEARRTQIIAAAAETVAELGYAQASLAKIAARAGVSKSVISYHFDGKDELLTTLVTQLFEEAWAHMEANLDAETTAAGRIRAWVASQLGFFAASRSKFLAMIEIVTSYRSPDGKLVFLHDEREELEALTEILEQGQLDGEFRDFDAASVAAVVKQCLEGLLGQWALDDATDLDTQTHVLTDFIDHAIRAEPTP